MAEGFGFGGKVPVLCSEHALDLAYAMAKLSDTSHALADAKKNVPDYMGQWSDEDYYANELEDYCRAAEEFERLVAKTNV